MSIASKTMRSIGALAVVLLGIASTVGSGGGSDAATALGCGSFIQTEDRLSDAQESIRFTMRWDYQDTQDSAIGTIKRTTTQWFRRAPGGDWAAIAGATGENYTLTPIYKLDNDAEFKATVRQHCASTFRDLETGVFRLLVNPVPHPEWVDLDSQFHPTQPADVTAGVGASASFMAMAYGNNSYQWQRSNDAGATWVDIAGATDWALTIPAVQAGDDGALFRLRASFRSATILSRAARLSVSNLPLTFDAALNASAISVGQGSSGSVDLTLTPHNGFNGSVTIAAAGLPTGMTLTPASVNVTGTAPLTQTLTIAVDASVGIGIYPLTITVDSGSLQQQLALQVTVPAAPDFSIAASPNIFNLVPGHQIAVDVTLTPTNALAGNVTLNLLNVPAALTVTPSAPVTLAIGPTAAATQRYTVALDAAAPSAGSFSFDVGASAGATSHNATVVVATEAPAGGYIQVGFDIFDTRDRLTKTGPGYNARVDLGLGQFGIVLDSTAATNVYTGQGHNAPGFVLTNRSTAPIVVPAGGLRLEVNGTYTVVPGGGLQMVAVMTASTSSSPAQATANISHTVSGTLPSQSVFTQSVGGGANVNVTQADRSGLKAQILMPQLTIPAGGTLNVLYQLQANFATGGDAMDFLTTPARICLTLPPGTLDHNIAIPMNWCQ